jgi:hypothetical protein
MSPCPSFPRLAAKQRELVVQLDGLFEDVASCLAAQKNTGAIHWMLDVWDVMDKYERTGLQFSICQSLPLDYCTINAI